MHGFTVGVSLLSGLTSGISYLGSPGYAYDNGIEIMFSTLAFIASTYAVAYIYLPPLVDMGCTSCYEFIEQRFASRRLRKAAACVFLLRVTLYLAIVLYAPALALSSCTGLPIAGTILVTGASAVLYTCHGGMAAVVWTDFMQSVTLLGGIFACVGVGLHYADAEGWASLSRDHKLVGADFFVPSPSTELTFWSATVGTAFNALAQAGTDQLAVQRYLSAGSMAEARKSVLVSGVLNFVSVALLALMGTPRDSSPSLPCSAPPLLHHLRCVSSRRPLLGVLSLGRPAGAGR